MINALLTRWRNWWTHRRALWETRLEVMRERNARGLCGDCGLEPYVYKNGNCQGCQSSSQL